MYPNHMPLVVLAKGQVVYKRGVRPHIGSLVSENQILQQQKQLLERNMLSKSMSYIQDSLLKGK
jgi:hypothetical protein